MNALNSNNTRNYGIDLLRILSMFMICILHTLNKGSLEAPAFSAIYETSWFIECFSIGAVNIYALISGYVGLNSRHKYSNIVMLWLQVAFYSVLFTLLSLIIGKENIGIKDIIGSLLPVSFSKYWFFTAYFALFFISPFLNTLIKKLEKKETENLLVICVVLFSLMPTFLLRDMFHIKAGYGFVWLAVLYIFGAYIKQYNPFEKLKTHTAAILYFGSSVLAFASKSVIEFATTKILGHSVYGNLLISYISPTILFSAIMLLVVFSRIKPKFVKLIKIATPLVFGIYIIHENEHIRPVLKELLEPITSLPVYIFPFAVIGIGLCIFIACITIEYARYNLFKLLKIKNLVDLTGGFLTKKIKNLSYFNKD